MIIIIISAQRDIRTALQTLDSGADNYICKGTLFKSDFTISLRSGIKRIHLRRQNQAMKDAIFDIKNYPASLFKLSEFGVEIAFKDFEEFPEDLQTTSHEFLMNLGISFMLLIGRGADYNEGCFLFPATGSNFYDAILFSFKLPNPNAIDPRLKIGYFQLCIFLPRSFGYLFPPPEELSIFIDKIQEETDNSEDLNPNWLRLTKIKIIEWIKNYRSVDTIF